MCRNISTAMECIWRTIPQLPAGTEQSHRYAEKAAPGSTGQAPQLLYGAACDVMAINEIVALAGYYKTIVNKWCCENRMSHFAHHCINYIPKAHLIDFFCSEEFRTVSRKTKWHIRTLRDFNQRLKADHRCAKKQKSVDNII